MNKIILQGKWRQLRGNLKTEWGRFTENDRKQLDGKIDQMVGLVQERYGYSQEGATKLLTRYLGAYGKRTTKPAVMPVKVWAPAFTVAGLFGLAAMGWFFFSRFLAENPEINAPPMSEEDYVTSPEMELV